jgi:hypothetical protein
LILDWKAKGDAGWSVDAGGRTVAFAHKPGSWQRSTVTIPTGTTPAPIVFPPTDGLEVRNVFFRESKEK